MKYPYFLCLALLLTLVAVQGTVADDRAQHADAAQVDSAMCTLGDCWKKAFPQVDTLVSGGLKALKAYSEGLEEKLETARKFDSTDPEAQQKSLDLQLAFINQYLEECESMKDGPMQPRHLIIMGNPLDHNSIVVSAESAYRDALTQYCGQPSTTPTYNKCARNVILLRDQNKDDLFSFLRVLGTGYSSVRLPMLAMGDRCFYWWE